MSRWYDRWTLEDGLTLEQGRSRIKEGSCGLTRENNLQASQETPQAPQDYRQEGIDTVEPSCA